MRNILKNYYFIGFEITLEGDKKLTSGCICSLFKWQIFDVNNLAKNLVKTAESQFNCNIKLLVVTQINKV